MEVVPLDSSDEQSVTSSSASVLNLPPSAHIKGTRTMPTGVDYELATGALPKIPKARGNPLLAGRKDKNAKHPKQLFFESFDVNKSGQLEAPEVLRFVGTWFDIPDLLEEDDDSMPSTRSLSFARSSVVVGSREPTPRSNTNTPRGTATSTGTSRGTSTSTGTGTGTSTGTGTGTGGAQNTKNSPRVPSTIVSTGTPRGSMPRMSGPEKAVMRTQFLRSFTQHTDSQIPLQLAGFLRMLRRGAPDEAEKGAVQELWNRLVRAREKERERVLAERREAAMKAARRAAFAT